MRLSKLGYCFVFFFVLCTAGYGAGRLFFHWTDGFYHGSILGDQLDRPEWNLKEIADGDKAEIEKMFSRPFRYLSKGTQSYVFESEDGQYVIKFLKQKHLNMAKPLEWAENIPFFSSPIQAKRQRREEKRVKIYTGWKLAYEEISQDTGVLFCQLNPTDRFTSTLTLIDKVGRKHVYDPNELVFYIQKKGVPLLTYLNKKRNEGDLPGAKKALRKLFTYLVDRSKRGVYDRDPAYTQNLGFIDDQPVNLDVGNLRIDPMITDPAEYLPRIKIHTLALKYWIEQHYPELEEEYQKNLEAMHEKSDDRDVVASIYFDCSPAWIDFSVRESSIESVC